MPIIPNDNPQPWSPPAWLVEKRKQREWREANKEKLNAYKREYNREYFRDPSKRERKNERARLNYALRKDEINARRREKYKERKSKKTNT